MRVRFPRACTLNWRDIHHMLAADRSSLEKSMQKETPVERRESVVWPQRRDHSRSEQAERAIFSGARGERCLATVSSSKQIGASRASDLSVDQGKSVVATVSSSKQIGASRASDLSVDQGKCVVWPQCRHRSRSEQVERAIFSGARGKSYLGVGMHNIETKGDGRRSR